MTMLQTDAGPCSWIAGVIAAAIASGTPVQEAILEAIESLTNEEE